MAPRKWQTIQFSFLVPCAMAAITRSSLVFHSIHLAVNDLFTTFNRMETMEPIVDLECLQTDKCYKPRASLIRLGNPSACRIQRG